MLLGTVQICGEKLSPVEVDDICSSLDTNSIRLLSLRDCKVKNQDFKNLMKSLSHSKSIIQLNLNLGLVSNIERVESLSSALQRNRSLTSLYLHGSPLGDEGAAMLCRGLALHPNVIYLDLGDCLLTDTSIAHITELLPSNGAKRGLHELTLSANPGISTKGWTKFFISMSASCCLKTLNLDYNTIGDYGAGCLAVVLASNNTIEVLDLEGTGISEFGAQAILFLVKKHPVPLQQIIMAENKIKESTKKAIQDCLNENHPTVRAPVNDHTTPMELNSTGGSSCSSSSHDDYHNPLVSNTNYWSVLGDTQESAAWATPPQSLTFQQTQPSKGLERVSLALVSTGARLSMEKQHQALKLQGAEEEDTGTESESESDSDFESVDVNKSKLNQSKGYGGLSATGREATTLTTTSSSNAKNSDSMSTREAVHDAYRAALERKNHSTNS